MKLTLDTETHVFFYEQDFYVLSNFSAFKIEFEGRTFDTAEAAYHWSKFRGVSSTHQNMIRNAKSAHDAFKYAARFKADRRPDWDNEKLAVMRRILRAKIEQHEYVRRKLVATGNRELIENSWRDNFWGWGEDRTGQNWLGKLWMELRSELMKGYATEG